MCCCCRSSWFCCCWCKATPLDKVKPGADKVCRKGRCTFNCPPSCEDVYDAERPEPWGDNKLFCPSGSVDVAGGDVVGGTAEFNFKCCPPYPMDNTCACACACANASCFHRAWCSAAAARSPSSSSSIPSEIV